MRHGRRFQKGGGSNRNTRGGQNCDGAQCKGNGVTSPCIWRSQLEYTSGETYGGYSECYPNGMGCNMGCNNFYADATGCNTQNQSTTDFTCQPYCNGICECESPWDMDECGGVCECIYKLIKNVTFYGNNGKVNHIKNSKQIVLQRCS